MITKDALRIARDLIRKKEFHEAETVLLEALDRDCARFFLRRQRIIFTAHWKKD